MLPRKLEGLDDFPAYGHHDRWAAVACGVQSEAVRAIAAAVTGWAEQLGVTIERWLEVYEPQVEVKRGEAPNTITLTVSARLRGVEEVPLPWSGTVSVTPSAAGIEPPRYEPTEETEES